MLKLLKFTGNTTDTDLLSTSSKTTNDSSFFVCSNIFIYRNKN